MPFSTRSPRSRSPGHDTGAGDRLRDLGELLAAIVAAPDDDAPRRVYADALLDAGDPRGELIHLQCELAAGGLPRGEAVARRRRVRTLLEAHGARWTAGLAGIATSPVFRRGFVDEVRVDPWSYPSVGDRLFTAAPALRGVWFEGITADGMSDQAAAARRVLDCWQRVLTTPAFHRLRGVGFGALGYDCRVFGEVTPGWDSVGDEALIAMLAMAMPQLDGLDARHADYTSHATLYADPLLKRLARLAICPANLSDAQHLFAALADARVRSLALFGEDLGGLKDPILSTLTELQIQALDLELTWRPAGLERFAYATTTIRDDHVDRAVACARDVRELSLDGQRVPGWERLAKADLLHLRVLRVHGSDVGATEAEAILRMPCAAQLETLQLRRIDPANRASLEQRFGVAIDAIEVGNATVYWR